MSEGSIDVQLQVCTSIMSITMDCEFVETQKEGRALSTYTRTPTKDLEPTALEAGIAS